jgi:CRISPR-associated protein Cmr5
MKTVSQEMAQAAYRAVKTRREQSSFDEYTTFAKKFPALLHTCGLAQAVAFAQAKQEKAYLADLADVLHAGLGGEIQSVEELAMKSRESNLSQYLRLSRHALRSATWLKRYVEALG